MMLGALARQHPCFFPCIPSCQCLSDPILNSKQSALIWLTFLCQLWFQAQKSNDTLQLAGEIDTQHNVWFNLDFVLCIRTIACYYFYFQSVLIFNCLDSSSDDDSVFDEEQLRGFQRGGGARDSGASSSSYSDHGQGASPYHHASSQPQGGVGERPRSQHYANYAIPGNTARHALADVMHNAQNARHCEWCSEILCLIVCPGCRSISTSL